MAMDVRVISLGTLAEHPLRDARRTVRTGHATTTLVRTDKASILIDPGLPAPALKARLDERAGLEPQAITHVFLTSFQADTCRGIQLFSSASWLIHAAEREAMGVPLARLLRDAGDADDATKAELEYQVSLLHTCQPAPDSIVPGVDLFPLPGVTPGLCGLLIAEPARTTLICGDAIPTIEHYQAGRVLTHARDPELAMESFREAVEIADILVLGRDNLVFNQSRPVG